MVVTVVCLFRQKYVPKGGPNGGNGGKGGDLILQADENVADLRNYHFKNIGRQKMGNQVVEVIKMAVVAIPVF